MANPDVRKGMPSVELSRAEFERRYRSRFVDPAFEPLACELDAIVAAAWDGYSNSRKAPRTRKAGPGFADPDYALSVDWLAAREAILEAQRRHDDAGETPRILLINGSSRSEHSCPGEMSKSWRLVKVAQPVFQEMGLAVDLLDLSRLTSEFGRKIHPCKSCVSTAMPLCHWPCSCYPNHALGQTGDWMNEIYPLWVAAHGIMIVTPVNWYHAPTGLKAMIDRLVCADGGNPDPTSTHGKKAAEAKALELKGWPYPKHLEGRISRSWSMATPSAPRRCAARCRTGSPTCRWCRPAAPLRWMATSAIWSHMRSRIRRSIRMGIFRRRRAMRRGRLVMPSN